MFVNKDFANFKGILNLIIPMIKNAKFSGYYFSMNTNIQGYFQICISVPLATINCITKSSFEKKLYKT